MTYFWLHYEQERIPLRQGETTIGRSPYCSVILAGGTVSRQHSALCVEGTVVSVSDLGSRNGTRVNGKLITGRTTLQPGDLLTIGACRLQINIGRPTSDARDNTEERPLSDHPSPLSTDPPLSRTLEEPKGGGGLLRPHADLLLQAESLPQS